MTLEQVAMAILHSPLSLRQLSERTGVSFATLSRIARGKGTSSKTLEILVCYFTGSPVPRLRKVISRRLRVGGQTFLMTIELEAKEKK